MKSNVQAAFQDRFAHDPQVIVRAPGRINLLGGHTDYNDGLVLPVAVDRAGWIAAASSNDGRSHLHALDLDSSASFAMDAIPDRQGDWADYPRGVAWALDQRSLRPEGIEAVLTSDVPVGAGMSSSAAVEVAFGYTWQTLSSFALDRPELAKVCQHAENGYVGVNCGIMDQMASAMGREGHAMMLDCRTLDIEPVPLPDGVAIVVADSGVRRELASSEYNVRRAQCEEAVGILSKHLAGIRALRDVSPAELERHRDRLSDVVYRRARHVVTDILRVKVAAQALRQADVNEVGRLMTSCHISLRDDYEVSSPELDQLAEAAWSVPGCYGARLTGAGFGGCIVALVTADAVPEFESHVCTEYQIAFNRRPIITICQSANGVERLV